VTNGEKKADWFKKGATLSDKSARKEFGITQEEIYEGIKDGKLQYHVNYVYENPYLKLLRTEVEAFVIERYGKDYLEKRKYKKELTLVDKELKRLKAQIATLEQRKIDLLKIIEK